MFSIIHCRVETSGSNRLWPAVRRSAAGLGLVLREEDAIAFIANVVVRMLDHLDGEEVGDFSWASWCLKMLMTIWSINEMECYPWALFFLDSLQGQNRASNWEVYTFVEFFKVSAMILPPRFKLWEGAVSEQSDKQITSSYSELSLSLVSAHSRLQVGCVLLQGGANQQWR